MNLTVDYAADEAGNLCEDKIFVLLEGELVFLVLVAVWEVYGA